MKLGPLSNIDKRSTMTSKNFNDDIILKNYDVTAIFPIYVQFEANRKMDFGCMAHNP